MPGLFQEHGSQLKRPSASAPIYTNQFFSGLVTQGNPLRPGLTSRQEERFYGTRTDVLIGGQNVEVSNRRTPIRRPGNPQYSPASYPGGVDAFYEFRLFNTSTEQIRVMVDTPATLYQDNGTNAPASVWTKSAGAGQTFMQYVANVLYFGNGVDQKKWVQTPTAWQASHVYLNLDGMGTYIIDSNGNLQQLTACVIPVINIAIAGSVLTVTFNQNVTSILTPGLNLVFDNLVHATFLNDVTDQTITITEVSDSTVQATFVYPDYASTADTGSCRVLEGGTPLSATSQPTWSVSLMGTTTDNTALWTNRGNPLQNFGLAGPTEETIGVDVGTAARGWQPNTYYSGLSAIIDSNGNLQTTTTAGKSGSYGSGGSGHPTWATTVGLTTTDGTVIWTMSKTAAQMTWTANTAYRTGDIVAATPAGGVPSVFQVQGYTAAQLVGSVNASLWTVPTTGAVGAFQLSGSYVSTNPAAATATGNSLLFDPAATGNNTTPMQWATLNSAGETTGYTNLFASYEHDFNMIVEAELAIPEPGNYTFTITHHDGMVWGVGGGATKVSGPSNDPFNWPVTAKNSYPVMGGTNQSGSNTDTFVVYFPAAGNYPLEIDYAYWYHSGRTLTLYMNGVTPAPGTAPTYRTSGSTAPTWPAFSAAYAPGYATVSEASGQLVWANIGPVADFAWTQKTNYLTSAGSIVDGNGYIQNVFESGVTSTTAPTFSQVLYALTADNPNLTWINGGRASVQPAGNLNTSNGGWSYCLALVNTLTDTVSNAGPVTTATGSFLGASGVKLSGGLPAANLIDPQADYVAIFRTKDGGATWYLIPSTGIANQNTPYTLPLATYLASGYTDTTPDAGLNTLITAALGKQNTPPPAGLINLTYHLGRIFGSYGNVVTWSSGPDTPVGNGNEGFAPANSSTFPSLVTRIVPTSIGALVFTVSDIYLIAGRGTSGSPLYPQPYATGVGLLSYNALDVNGTTIYFMTSDSQVVSLNPGAGIEEIGLPIGDQFESWNPANAYVAWHVSGSQDKALYIGDGSTGWFRFAFLPGNEPAWSPKATIVGGCRAVQSVEVSPGVHKLLVGPSGTGQVLARSLTNFQDNGQSYPASFIIGSLILAEPGQIAVVKFLTLEATRQGSAPEPSVLLGEISGTFEQLPLSTPDPPRLPASTSLYSLRFYLSQTEDPAICRHMQVQVSWPTEAAANELLSLTLFGNHAQED